MTITTEGLVFVDYATRRASLAARFAELAGANVATDEGTPEGDLITLTALAAQEVADVLALTYASRYLRTSSGVSLDLAADPIVGPRAAAQPSVAEAVPLEGDAGTVIPAGSAISPTGSDVRWMLLEEVTLDGSGEGVGDFQASVTGPLAAVTNTTWTISTPVAGWATAGPSTQDAEQGSDEESDQAYRLRATEAQRIGSIARAVWRVEGVSLVSIIEEQGDGPDAYWGLGHWVELLVVGGTDADVGAAIHSARAPGVNTVGNTSVVIPAPGYLGDEVTVRFSRAIDVDVYIRITVQKGEGYPSSTSADAIAARVAAFRNSVLTWGASVLLPGVDVYAGAVQAVAFGAVPGVKSLSVLIGTTDPPAGSEVPIAIRERAVLDSARIEVVGA